MLSRLREAAAWRLRAARIGIRHFPVRLEAWLAFRRGLSRYRVLSETELRATRKSNTVFIFGSGYSLNEISEAEWRAFEAHDTVGFNWFVHQRFVRCDYQLVRETGPGDLDPAVWRKYLIEYFNLMRGNPQFARAVLLIQTGFRAISGNRSIGLGLAPNEHPIFLWRSAVGRDTPTNSFKEGLTHAHGTLEECINFAFLMGWTTIVLVGVDLYDRRYFWLGAEEPRPEDPAIGETHKTALHGIVDELGRWRTQFQQAGVEMYVHNPRSLLAGPLPVWTAPTS